MRVCHCNEMQNSDSLFDVSLCQNLFKSSDVTRSRKSLWKSLRKKKCAKFSGQLRHKSLGEIPRSSRHLFSNVFGFRKRSNSTLSHLRTNGSEEPLRRSLELKKEELQSSTPTCTKAKNIVPQNTDFQTEFSNSTRDLLQNKEPDKLFLLPTSSAKPIIKSNTLHPRKILSVRVCKLICFCRFWVNLLNIFLQQTKY